MIVCPECAALLVQEAQEAHARWHVELLEVLEQMADNTRVGFERIVQSQNRFASQVTKALRNARDGGRRV